MPVGGVLPNHRTVLTNTKEQPLGQTSEKDPFDLGISRDRREPSFDLDGNIPIRQHETGHARHRRASFSGA